MTMLLRYKRIAHIAAQQIKAAHFITWTTEKRQALKGKTNKHWSCVVRVSRLLLALATLLVMHMSRYLVTLSP